MKRILTMLSLLMMGLIVSSCYDDSDLWESVSDLDERMKAVEELCTQMNTNISSLQELVASSQKGVYITDVKPLTENDVEVGYTITLSDGKTVTIYHGKSNNGEDGQTPQIGVKQDTDGKYYWMVDGEWLTDPNGNKMPVTPESGKAGATPSVKIENDTWYVSYDNGTTWEELGSAVPEGFCLFKDVTYNNGVLTFTFADGNVLSLTVAGKMKIVLGEYDPTWGNMLEIPYAIEGAVGEVMIFATTDLLGGDHEVWVREIVEETSTTGVIKVEVGWWDEKEYQGRLAIFAVDETGTTVSKIVRLATGVLYETDNIDYDLSGEASQLTIKVTTNRTLKVSTDADWITYVETKAVEDRTLLFDVKKNEEGKRTANVTVESGNRSLNFSVTQNKLRTLHKFSVAIEHDKVV